MIDNAYLIVKSGNGGNGSGSFRRAKYIPKGGPDGGDGGDGGSVWLVGTNQKSTLREFTGQKRYEAKPGEQGGKNQLFGANAEDVEIALPLGTVVWEVSAEVARRGSSHPPAEDEKRWLGEITDANARILVAKGGEGGWGNVHFKSSRNTTPLEYEEGQPGEEKFLWLELKLLADVGFVGLPNAGKSTLLSVLTKAQPKIADYPFTTITPNLGVIEFSAAQDRQQYVLADIPGLIEQASEGKGLGIQFLRHVERCRLLLFVLSPESDWIATQIALAEQLSDSERSGVRPELVTAIVDHLLDQWRVVATELEQHSQELMEKPFCVVMNKIDVFEAPGNALTSDPALLVEQVRQALEARLRQEALSTQMRGSLAVISAVTRSGIDALRNLLQEQLSKLPAPSVTPETKEAELPVITPEMRSKQAVGRAARHRILRKLKA